MSKLKLGLLLFLVILAAFSGLSLQILIQLPNVDEINYYNPSQSTVIFSGDDNVLARVHQEENRRVVPLSKISPWLQRAVIAVEDERFYLHAGVDLTGILRAFAKNLTSGRVVQGGSTVTQQLARNIFLTRQRTLTRKLAETILAFQIERKFSKEEILELYLNQIYFGHNCYGAESAAYIYFNKHADELTLGEAALLAGLIEGPEILSPYKNQEWSFQRQRVVLKKMLDLKIISRTEAEIAAQTPIKLYPKNIKRLGDLAPYFISYIQKELIEKFGEEVVYKGGLKVYTTLDPNIQDQAEQVIKKFAQTEGAKYHFSQAALVAIDPRDGHIKALVGGVDFTKSQYNRAIQAKRQPGSSFKPFVYTTAIKKEFSPAFVLSDRPVTFKVFPNRWNPFGSWQPKNFDRKYHGNVTMRKALEMSYNIPAIKMLEMVGVNSVISTAHEMGIESRLEPALALALGVSEVTLLEMTSAYGVLANAGVRLPPVAILKIEDRDKKVVYEYEPQPKDALDANVAAVMIDMMKGVLARGTGVRGQIGRPAAAKTGTSQEFKDAWFVGFVPQLVAGVWVGNDDNSPMKGVAEVAVCPRIWKEFMQGALASEPALDFPAPQGMVKTRICLSSGLLPNEFCPAGSIVADYFFPSKVPLSKCYVHPKEKPNEEDDEPLMEMTPDIEKPDEPLYNNEEKPDENPDKVWN